jgi:hypothetical protein
MDRIAGWIDRVLLAGLRGETELANESAKVRGEIKALCERFPLPHATLETA